MKREVREKIENYIVNNVVGVSLKSREDNSIKKIRIFKGELKYEETKIWCVQFNVSKRLEVDGAPSVHLLFDLSGNFLSIDMEWWEILEEKKE